MNGNERRPIQPNSDNRQSRQVVRQETVQFSGPLPPPAMIEHYEKILPGAAERIFKMAEDQSSHRKQLESKVIDTDSTNSRRGLIFGFLIGLVALGVSVLLVYLGNSISGVIIALAYITSLVGAFIYGSRQRRTEREERRQQAQ